MSGMLRRILPWATAATVLTTLSCTDTVFRDRPNFAPPPSAAGKFLGYSSEIDKETVCGNCHVGHQGDWERTAHADAWETLQASGSAQAFCQDCHTVGKLGNVTDADAGYTATQDERYHDVQCESCHGPGLDHVEAPDGGTVPLAPITVGLDLTVGCGECHNGTHYPFVEEWAQSGHGNADTLTSPVNRPECIACHTAQGALQAWGITANYIEKNAPLGQHEAIVCAVCHDPHGQETADGSAIITGQLRYPVDSPSEEENLCVKCHHKRSQPDIDPITQNSRGPHSPEGPLLLGENVGFWFGETPLDNEKIIGTHGSEANPRLCAQCHMEKFSVTDEVTGELISNVVGHRFLATPCVDANGLPTGLDDCPKTTTARSYRGCAASGCHTEGVAASLDTVVFQRIDRLAVSLKSQLDQPVVKAAIKSNDGVWTTAEGANFNHQLAIREGSHVHNPFLVEALMIVSIREVTRVYGVLPTASVSLERQLGVRKTAP